ncbi:MAG: glycosyltransferase [Bacteroidetes bacterium]|nr:glycosyltransferase [Bacteroidota bacterium]
MNILQVLSQFEVTGAETFAATLADMQIAQGHTVTILSDNFYTPTKATVITHPIGKRDIAQRKKNVEFLRQFIREHRIDVVHAHSRAASWVCYFATRGGNVPLVSSIHGRQHLHFSSKLFSIYGEKRVAVCRSIYDHLNRDLKYPLDTLALVHNGIDLSKWEFRPHQPPPRKKKIVAFVGRLSGFKGDTLLVIIDKVFPKVREAYPDVEFHIIGGMNEKSKILLAIAATNQREGVEFILAKGFSKDVESVYRTSDVVVGSGRVAMEALACGSPVISIGESNYVGIISERTRSEALITNFGDLDARRPIDVQASIRDILSALQHPEAIDAAWGRRFIEENFEITAVAAQMERVYAEAAARKQGNEEMPVLRYTSISGDGHAPEFPPLHRSADLTGNNRAGVQDGEERTVRLSEFDAQMNYLAKNGFTPVTCRQILQMAAFRIPVPAKPVLLTFEHHAANLRAVPVLKNYGFPALFFVRTGPATGNDGPGISFDDARQLLKDGFEIGSASHTIPKMNLLTPEQQREEIAGSRRLLSEQLGTEPLAFAYPHGYITEAIKGMVQQAGYALAFTVDEGRRCIWTDLLKIRRIQIFAGTSKFSFWKKTSGRYLWYTNVY